MSAQRSSIQIITALVLALAAGALVFFWMQSRPRSQAPGQAEVMIALAARDLDQGRAIGPGDLRLGACSLARLPEQPFRDLEGLAGRVTIVAVPAGRPVTGSDLAPLAQAAGGVSALIAPGMRAIAVQGNKVMGISGFVHPGSRVDVLATLDVPDGNRSKAVTKLVLQNVPVLASGTSLEPAGPGGQTSPVDVYTLELTPEQSERLALAATQGTLHFALRNPADDRPAQTQGMDVGRMLAGLSKTAPAPVARPAAAQAASLAQAVEVIRGLDRQTMRFEP